MKFHLKESIAMSIIHGLIDFILHIDEHLVDIIQQFGNWSYGILFSIVFVETGIVIMPFLPGDSLLFASGTLAALGAFNLATLLNCVFCCCGSWRYGELSYWE